MRFFIVFILILLGVVIVLPRVTPPHARQRRRPVRRAPSLNNGEVQHDKKPAGKKVKDVIAPRARTKAGKPAPRRRVRAPTVA